MIELFILQERNMGMFEQAIQDIQYFVQMKNYDGALLLIDCLLVAERAKNGNV